MKNTDYVSRAWAAWYSRGNTGQTRMYPASGMGGHVTLPDGREYVVMANSYQVLGVYRIRPSGFLRLLRRWPKAVEQAVGFDNA